MAYGRNYPTRLPGRILKKLEKVDPIDIHRISRDLRVNQAYARCALHDLVNEGKIYRFGETIPGGGQRIFYSLHDPSPMAELPRTMVTVAWNTHGMKTVELDACLCISDREVLT